MNSTTISPTSPVINNCKELRTRLLTVFNEIKDGILNHQEAKEMNAAAGRVIGSIKLELEYAKLIGIKPKIEFLEG